MTTNSTEVLLAPYERPFVRNTWYCAGWPHEFVDKPFARRILDEPVLLYRATTGEAIALSNVCPHKLAPMDIGFRSGDNVGCGYHGLEFDKHGVCVKNPQGNCQIPRDAMLRSYPVVERHGAVWIWMGDAGKADPSLIADFSHIEDPRRKTVKGGHLVRCNYMVMVENLLDLGHGLFLHGESAGLAGAVLSEAKLVSEGNTLFDLRLYEKVTPPKAFGKYLPGETVVDFWTDIRWNAPSLLRNYTGAAPLGHPRDEVLGVDQMGSHFLTPETQSTTHYFYAHSRNHARDDAAADEFYRQWQRKALRDEDGAVAERIQQYVPDARRLGIKMVSLSTDASGFRVNRILDKLAEADAVRS